jgi:Ca-activated chloride channel family protein
MNHLPTDAKRLRLVSPDSDPQPPARSSRVETSALKSGLSAIVPSWLLSLVLHAGLFVVLAISLPGLRGGIVGDPDGDLRSVGIWVGHSGDGSDGDGGGKGPAKDAAGETKLVPAIQIKPPATPAAPATPTPTTEVVAPRVEPVVRTRAAGAVPSAVPPPPVIGPGERPGLFRRSDEPQSSGPPAINSGTNGKQGGGPRGSRGSTPFFGIVDVGSRFVYVIDCSGSMFSHNAMGAAKSEVIRSLHTLNRFQQFQIVFYNTDQKWLKAPGKMDFRYFSADEKSLRLASAFVAEIDPDGGTQHLTAIELALRLQPDVIFFLTDGGKPGLGPFDLAQLKQLNERHARIHCVQFASRDDPDAAEATDFLQKLAAQNGGDFVCRDVAGFDAPSALRASARTSGEEH